MESPLQFPHFCNQIVTIDFFKKMKNPTPRIASIDILRGADLFLLLFLQPVILSLTVHWDTPWAKFLRYQLDHEVWIGFRFWDLIMPLFLFLVGASMPFSFSKFRNTHDRGGLYRKILRRVVILFLLGMIVQGNLLGFSADSLMIYNNTLQAIAIGYLIAAIILLNFRLPGQIICTCILLLLYSVPMAIYGYYEPENSLAFEVDKFILGNFRGDLTYTWVWSSLTFGATVMLGALSGEILKKNHSGKRMTTVGELVVAGIVLIAAGLLAGLFEPIIKRLWTSSMTIFSGGICMLLVAIFYWWIDVKGHSRGWNWLKIYGINAITAYCLGEVIDFRSIVRSLTYGLEHIIPAWYPFILTLGNASVLFLILYIMYKSRVMIKI